MKNKTGYIAAMFAILHSENNIFSDETMNRIKKQDIEEKKKIALSKKRTKNGLKPYFYGDNVIYSRNKKNADRKARNKGYL